MEGMGRLQFSDLSQNCQFHHMRLESLEYFNVSFYIILSTMVSVLDLKEAILFYKVSFFVYTLHVCYVFNII